MKSRIVITIHDGVYVEAPVKEKDQACYWIKRTMEEALEMPILPLDVEIG